MTTSGFDSEFIPAEVRVDDEMIHVRFESGLVIATPVARFPRLQQATADQRRTWRLIGRGDGIHWPDVDEDISVRGLFSKGRRLPSSSIEQVPALIGDLYRATTELNRLFKGRPFTPDGHLVGSIGEVVAEYIYGLALSPCSTPRIDAYTADQKSSVQIKLTGAKGTAYGIRWSNVDDAVPPELLLCMKLTETGFSEIYNGVFPTDLLRGRKDQKNGQVSVTVSSLKERNPSLLPKINSFESVNRWFTPQLADVA